MRCEPAIHYSVDLRIQTYTEPVTLKCGKLATEISVDIGIIFLQRMRRAVQWCFMSTSSCVAVTWLWLFWAQCMHDVDFPRLHHAIRTYESLTPKIEFCGACCMRVIAIWCLSTSLLVKHTINNLLSTLSFNDISHVRANRDFSLSWPVQNSSRWRCASESPFQRRHSQRQRPRATDDRFAKLAHYRSAIARDPVSYTHLTLPTIYSV